jgi:predicted helicase
LTIHPTIDKVLSTVKKFSKLDPETARQVYSLGEDSRDWKVKLAQDDITSSPIDSEKVVKILYRPFDVMYTYYTGKSRGFICMPRREIMQHLLQENLALITVRQVAEETFNHSFVSESLVECRVTLSNKGYGYLFPLYLHYNDAQDTFHEKISNINEVILSKVKQLYDNTISSPITDLDIFSYIYAVLFSNRYRKKFSEFLKIDFPRIPFVKSYNNFVQLSKVGGKLIQIHLLKDTSLEFPTTRYFGTGHNQVERLLYKDEKLYINDVNYFGNIKQNVFEYMLNGYQVCHKWLKDRKGKELTLEEVQTYCKIVTALEKTIELQKEIDEVIEI